MGFFQFVIIFILLSVLIERVIRKRLGIEKKKISETAGKNVDRWGRGIILVTFLATFSYFIDKDDEIVKWYWISYYVILMGFQTYIQWKYLKDSKEYILSLIFLVLGIVFLLSVDSVL
ncbi:DUF4181 domain-containing protein [Schinkia azotoformans]|uniref:DUF4181 domain-containing protein n=1 Tax=Schinkia azotoformans LMG 9581 TaxID=1131731 RepID=K6DJH4_SCHAZ|nr:DUF4181 domain-containing protein [Schinkia azotoformans]EKN68268.1 hypothetical protein BAZO_04480 [Schinkia azotoformans LMG 9581]MEC1638618.1 DUF4181 domain-containing protein [Schinkia azotoformans]MEC1718531.1 DUF4181 domain-containing protein [Schinkia azotoformans]MEC1721478.1 DUF4181 domain-containing protein [Schinkia azotoformans]MEC1743669.1 DUF4181 domain-containing protein [Schinkia azotoformans]